MLRKRWLSTCVVLALAWVASCGGGGGDGVTPPAGPAGPPIVIPPTANANLLPIASSFQQTAVWCWAAVTEMVFRYYGVRNVNPFGNFQCGIVAVTFGGICTSNCGLAPCVRSIGSAPAFLDALTNYAERLSLAGLSSRDVDAVWLATPLSFAELKAEINAGRPIVAGISPGQQFVLPGNPMHAVLLTGFYEDVGLQLVVVNDPFPYNYQAFVGNPYVAVGTINSSLGQYIVRYDSLLGSLRWSDSFVGVAPH